MARTVKKTSKSPLKRITTKAVQATEHLPPTVPTVTVKPETDEDAWGEDGLTIRQRLFVDALIGPAGGNATRAAEMAGYASENYKSLTVTAHRLLVSASLQDAIGRRLAARKQSPDWAVTGLIDIASATMASFMKRGDDGTYTLDLDKAAAAGALGQIKEWREEVMETVGAGAKVMSRTIKLHDRRAALETLLKLQGKLAEHHIVSGPNGGPVRHAHARDETEGLLSDPQTRDAAMALAERMSSVAKDDDPSRN